MSDASKSNADRPDGAAADKPLSDPARRALAEAEERRKAREAEAQARPDERGGPKGPEPTRYGDWEKKGITYDF